MQMCKLEHQKKMIKTRLELQTTRIDEEVGSYHVDSMENDSIADVSEISEKSKVAQWLKKTENETPLSENVVSKNNKGSEFSFQTSVRDSTGRSPTSIDRNAQLLSNHKSLGSDLNDSEIRVVNLKGPRKLKIFCDHCHNGLSQFPKILDIDDLKTLIN
ncbi:hypothetical protein JTB14_014421 [Gonioctena quinquepunctata]|nr:hypothetical protein JTB14_014421 [Gonioctena quinquepunctata]